MKNFFNNFAQSQLDEVVFENRNKQYGAYAIRRDYDHILSKSLVVGAAVFGILAMTPFVINQFSKTEVVIGPPLTPERTLKNVTEVFLPPKEIKSFVAPHVKTVTSPDYKPVRDVVKDQPIPTVKARENAAIGPVIQDGPVTSQHYVPVVSPTPTVATVPTTTAPVDKPLDPNAIVKEVDVEARFSGGINSFRERVGQNFDTSAITDNGMLSTVVTFIVEKDGSISNIKATGKDDDFNKEAERAVKAVKSKWVAAKFKNQAVRSYFKIPISMRIE